MVMIAFILKKSLIYSLVGQGALVCIFFFGSILKREEFGFDYGVYTAILSIQFFPILFCFFCVLFIIIWQVKKGNNKL
jgi:hypothetical protein